MNTRAQEWIQQIEETEGRKLEPEMNRGISLVDKLAIAFKAMGQRDAVEGNEAFTAEEFREWGNKQLPNAPETAACLAELMQLHYMDGYEGGAA